jgi:hypothetical protein
MAKITIGGIIKTSIVTAFTIAAALIWKDLVTQIIERFVPPGEKLLYNFIAAILATIVVIIVIYIILKTESEVEVVFKKLKKNKKNKK